MEKVNKNLEMFALQTKNSDIINEKRERKEIMAM